MIYMKIYEKVNHENEYITTTYCNNVTGDVLDTKIRKDKLVNKFVLDEKINTIAAKKKKKDKKLPTKARLKRGQDKFTKF